MTSDMPTQGNDVPPQTSERATDKREEAQLDENDVPSAAPPVGKFGLLTLTITGILLIAAVATVHLSARQQAVFAVATWIVFISANRLSKGAGVTAFLVMLSLAVSLRYVFWRVTETLQFDTVSDTVLGYGLVGAEVYAVLVLVCGYIQNAMPLHRKPVPLSVDPTMWPTVDVFIPTYNESLDVVRTTVLGALEMDWPRDRFKVWLLDDGRRAEFRHFAEEVGCGYITRANNAHAKAGNLNNALKHTRGEYIAIFDCDHIPTRAFLQLTLGSLVADPHIALVQTPHHFYSPDPFQRNLAAGVRVPPEGNLFYGLIQDGNDYWNAAFFCGSCAVLRRAALDDIGGFAVETVTEDAHTMLRMHRRGWSSAYLRLPLAAGLATERLALHIGQRLRWARGMLQILRLDCPLFGPGLTLGQRICYMQAACHFLFPIPRIIFLTAPLAFLLFGCNVISASPLAITAYALPHILHAIATNARIQKSWRHSFWSEIYETVLALSLIPMTVVTLLFPHRGKFNVTAKGGVLRHGFFDWRAIFPNLILCVLLVAGMAKAVYCLAFLTLPALAFQAFLLNAIWAFFSLLMVMAALAVGRETRQLRVHARVRAELELQLHLADGNIVPARSQDLSQSGLQVLCVDMPALDADSAIEVCFTLEDREIVVPARVIDAAGDMLRLRWTPSTLQHEADIVRVVFGRADAWLEWNDYPEDRVLRSLWNVLVSISGLIRRSGKLPWKKPRAQVAALAAMMAFGLVIAPLSATAQTVQPPVRLAPEEVSMEGAPSGGAGPVPMPPVSPVTTPSPVSPPSQPVGAVIPSAPAASTPFLAQGVAPSTDGTRTVTRTLRELGAAGPLTLRGTSELQGLEFGIRGDEVVTAAQLVISGAMSPALIPNLSDITVTLNEQWVATIPVKRAEPTYHLAVPLNPLFFGADNRLNFRFTGQYTRDCNDPLSGLLWSKISDQSTITLTLQHLPPQLDLAQLPAPFFDAHDKDQLFLPFVLADHSNGVIQTASVAASWFGDLASFRGARFPVTSALPARGNAVAVVVGTDRPEALASLPAVRGPTLAVVPNPNDPFGVILVIAGRTDEEVLAAARSLALGSRVLSGQSALVSAPQIPERRPYDAPAWVPGNRPIKLGELAAPEALQAAGYVNLIRVPFRTAPDLYRWRDRPFPLDIALSGPTAPVLDLATSRVDVGVNGTYLKTLPLAYNFGPWFGWLSAYLHPQTSREVGVPDYLLFGENELQFFSDLRPLKRGACVAIPGDIHVSVDPNSTIDFSSAYHLARMPNLASFANGGFPFSRMADLSQTTVVVPARPTEVELSALLTLMGRFGAITGLPATGVEVRRPEEAATALDRDLLLLGAFAHFGNVESLLTAAPISLRGGRVTIDLPTSLPMIGSLLDGRRNEDRNRLAAGLSAATGGNWGVMVGTQSPLQAHRSVIALLAASPQGVDALVSSLAAPNQRSQIKGDMVLLNGGRISSYRVGSTYTVGKVPLWLWPSWYLEDSLFVDLGMMLVGCALLALAFYWGLRRRASRRLREAETNGPRR